MTIGKNKKNLFQRTLQMTSKRFKKFLLNGINILKKISDFSRAASIYPAKIIITKLQSSESIKSTKWKSILNNCDRAREHTHKRTLCMQNIESIKMCRFITFRKKKTTSKWKCFWNWRNVRMWFKWRLIIWLVD